MGTEGVRSKMVWDASRRVRFKTATESHLMDAVAYAMATPKKLAPSAPEIPEWLTDEVVARVVAGFDEGATVEVVLGRLDRLSGDSWAWVKGHDVPVRAYASALRRYLANREGDGSACSFTEGLDDESGTSPFSPEETEFKRGDRVRVSGYQNMVGIYTIRCRVPKMDRDYGGHYLCLPDGWKDERPRFYGGDGLVFPPEALTLVEETEGDRLMRFFAEEPVFPMGGGIPQPEEPIGCLTDEDVYVQSYFFPDAELWAGRKDFAAFLRTPQIVKPGQYRERR